MFPSPVHIIRRWGCSRVLFRGIQLLFSVALLPAFGAAATIGGTVVFASEYGRKLKNRIKELVKKNSGKAYSESKIETFVT